MTIGFDKPLYVLPFDHRATFQTKMFAWKGTLTPAQSQEITAAKRVIYDGFKAALAAGVPKEKAGILVDEQFGSDILRDAARNGFGDSLSPASLPAPCSAPSGHANWLALAEGTRSIAICWSGTTANMRDASPPRSTQGVPTGNSSVTAALEVKRRTRLQPGPTA